MKNDLRRTPHAQVTAARLCRSHSHAKSVSPRPLGGSSTLGSPTRTLLVHRPRRPRSPSRHVHDPSAMYRSRSVNGNRGGRRSWGNRKRDGGSFRPSQPIPRAFPTTKRRPHGNYLRQILTTLREAAKVQEFRIPSRVNHDLKWRTKEEIVRRLATWKKSFKVLDTRPQLRHEYTYTLLRAWVPPSFSSAAMDLLLCRPSFQHQFPPGPLLARSAQVRPR